MDRLSESSAKRRDSATQCILTRRFSDDCSKLFDDLIKSLDPVGDIKLMVDTLRKNNPPETKKTYMEFIQQMLRKQGDGFFPELQVMQNWSLEDLKKFTRLPMEVDFAFVCSLRLEDNVWDGNLDYNRSNLTKYYKFFSGVYVEKIRKLHEQFDLTENAIETNDRKYRALVEASKQNSRKNERSQVSNIIGGILEDGLGPIVNSLVGPKASDNTRGSQQKLVESDSKGSLKCFSCKETKSSSSFSQKAKKSARERENVLSVQNKHLPRISIKKYLILVFCDSFLEAQFENS